MSDSTINAGHAPQDIAAWVGLDWANKEHSICLYDVRSTRAESYTVKHTAEALQEWLAGLRARYGGAKVAVALEQSRGSVLYALMSCDFIVLYPVNPKALSRYREAMFTSGAKSDPNDAALLCDMVRKHPEHFRAWVAEDFDTRSLRLLVEDRRKLVNQLTRLTNQLTSQLKNYFPQALDWAGDLDQRQACDFLERWPTLEELQNARPSTLRKFYSSYGRAGKEVINKRVEEIKQAVALTQDIAVVESSSMMVLALVRQIRALTPVIEGYDDRIKQRFQKHPDCFVFKSLPGAGPALAPRLLAAFGADRDRWKSAAEVQSLAGIAPVTEQSGNSRWVHQRWACPKFLRQTFHEFALQSVIWCDWAKAYYRQQRDERGKARHAAARALAYKWIRILYRCWKDRVAYDEQKYLEALSNHGSDLPRRAEAIKEAKRLKKVA